MNSWKETERDWKTESRRMVIYCGSDGAQRFLWRKRQEEETEKEWTTGATVRWRAQMKSSRYQKA